MIEQLPLKIPYADQTPLRDVRWLVQR